MVRRELGPDAAVLHTREVRNRWLGWLPGPRQIEVTASRGVNVPSRLPCRTSQSRRKPAGRVAARVPPVAAAEETTTHAPGAGPTQHLAGDGEGPLPAVEVRRPRRLARGTVPPVHRTARRRIERGRGPRAGRRRPQRPAGRRPFRPDAAEGPRGGDDRERHSRGRPDRGHARPLPAGGAGGADRRGQDHHHRQAGGQFPPEGKTPRGADHGRHLSHRRGRAVADLRRHHRPADARRLDAAGNARDGGADEPSRLDPAGHRRPQPQGRSPHSGTQDVSGRGRRRRSAPGPQQRGRGADPRTNRRTIRRRRRHGA